MWYENTGSILSGGWTARNIAPSFDQVAVAKSSDINHDGRIDIILSPSEAVGRVRWFECPQDPKTQPWNEHILGDQMNSIHGLGIADFDGDGDADIAASEFRGSQRLIIFKNDNYSGTKWSSQILGTQALHNIVVEDFDSDGDYDIFGSYCWNTPPAYLWINGSHGRQKYKFFLVPIYQLLLKK